MASYWTLLALRSHVASESGLTGSEYNANATLTNAVNRAITKVWNFITKEEYGYGEVFTTLTATVDVATVDLPADHMRTRLVQRQYVEDGTDFYEPCFITQGNFYRRYRDSSLTLTTPGYYWYTPTSLELRPVPTFAEDIRLVYVQTAPVLVDDADNLDLVAGFEESVINLAIAHATLDRGRRADHMQLGQQALSDAVAQWATNRDSTPDRASKYR